MAKVPPEFESPDDAWRAFLMGTHPSLQSLRKRFAWIPSNPRCKICHAPFGAPGKYFLGRYGYVPWEKNPNMCKSCVVSLEKEGFSGAEVPISLLFADVRGSSTLAKEMSPTEFHALLNRFYAVATRVLVDTDALLDKFVGDEVIGLYVPGFAGDEHADRALEAARRLLRETGHGTPDGPWIPLGAAVHTGTAFVGQVGSAGKITDITALGDDVNTTAHLAGRARTGEIMVTDAAAGASGISTEGLERRNVELKHEQTLEVYVLPAATPVGA
jgi:adenylate cyclase